MRCDKIKESQRVNYLSHMQISACPGDRRLDIHIFRHHKCRLKLRSCFALATGTPCDGPKTEAAFHQQWPHTKFVGDRSCGALSLIAISPKRCSSHATIPRSPREFAV